MPAKLRTPKAPPRLSLSAETAADLMVLNPVSIRANATVKDAVVLFTDRGISAAPVIDEAGHPVGVISHSDIIAHDRERELNGHGASHVRDIMTPALFSVPPELAAAKVVEQMVGLNVHRLFVVDSSGLLLGVISTFDILSKLRV
jgi:predicted transcriptional regulator